MQLDAGLDILMMAMNREGWAHPRDLFGVGVRYLGLVSAVYGIYELFFILLGIVGVQFGRDFPQVAVFMASGFFLVLGVVLMSAAEWLVTAAYGAKEPDI